MTRSVVLMMSCVVSACSASSAVDAGLVGGASGGGGASAGGAAAAAGGAATAGGGAAEVPLSTFCKSTTLEAVCDFEVRCGRSRSKTGCVADLELTSRRYGVDFCSGARPSLRDGRQQYEPTVAARCFADLATLDCRLAGFFPPSCSAVFSPRVPVGGACFDSGRDCLDGWCDSSSTCPGVCRAHVGAGSLVTNGEACAEGLTLAQESSPTGSVWRCVAVSKLGEPCNPQSANVCEAPLVCSAVTGRCVAPRAAGAPCEVIDAGAGRQPLFGNICESTLLCQPGDAGVPICAGLRDLGEPCSYCMRDLRCALATPGSRSGLCAPKGLGGDICLMTADCAPGFFCAGSPGTCQAQLNVGQACTHFEACQPGLDCVTDGGAALCMPLDGGGLFGCVDPTP